MTALSGSINSLSEQLHTKQEEKLAELCALQTACAIAAMDPHTREDFIAFLHDLNRAQSENDQVAYQYFLDAIVELFHHRDPKEFANAATLDEWEAEIESTPEGREAMRNEGAAQAEFHAAYMRFKERAGYRTQQEVADAAGLSPTTIRKIEAGGCRPHFGTLTKIAKAFNVSVEELWKRAG